MTEERMALPLTLEQATQLLHLITNVRSNPASLSKACCLDSVRAASRQLAVLEQIDGLLLDIMDFNDAGPFWKVGSAAFSIEGPSACPASANGIRYTLLAMAEAGHDAVLGMFEDDVVSLGPGVAADRLLFRSRDIDRIVRVLGLGDDPSGTSYEAEASAWLLERGIRRKVE